MSLRWRLQAWYALVFVGVVAGFSVLLYYRAEASQRQELENELEAAALYLDANLRQFPPHELDQALSPPPRRPEPPPDESGSYPPGRPPRPSRERFLAHLELPQSVAEFGPHDRFNDAYFAVWRHDGSLLKASPHLRIRAPAGTGTVPIRQREQGPTTELKCVDRSGPVFSWASH